MVTVALARNVRVPSAQVTTPEAGGLQVPCVPVALTKVEPGGSVSEKLMPVAVSGPLLSTRIV